jgi:hypothetical protein
MGSYGTQMSGVDIRERDSRPEAIILSRTGVCSIEQMHKSGGLDTEIKNKQICDKNRPSCY